MTDELGMRKKTSIFIKNFEKWLTLIIIINDNHYLVPSVYRTLLGDRGRDKKVFKSLLKKL